MSDRLKQGDPEFRSDWDVMRDDDGNPITITVQQSQAIWHALRVVEAVRHQEGCRSLWSTDWPQTEIGKSRLLGRMLFDGLPPTITKPSYEYGGPAWHHLPGGDPFDSETGESS